MSVPVRGSRLPIVFAALSAALLVGAFAFLSYGVAPAQREAGGWAQKIFYCHLPAAILSFGFLFGGMLSGVGFLAWRDPRMCRASQAMVFVGWFAATLVLLTGPFWARPVWGKWWNWEPRLTSFAFLWFAYSAYHVLGPAVADREKRRSLQAVYAILAFVSVPIVIYSTRFVPEAQQLHPPRIEYTRRMSVALGGFLVALGTALSGIFYLKYRLLTLGDRIEELFARRHSHPSLGS